MRALINGSLLLVINIDIDLILVFLACGGDPMRLQMTNEDEELDIDGDVQTEFGLPQYPIHIF